MIIAIVDDCERDKSYLKNLCTTLSLDKENSIIEFSSGTELMEYCDNRERIDLLFLDIEMPDIDGITIKDKVQNMDMIFRIVFVSSHNEVVFDAFGYKVMGFISKPATIEKVQLYTEKVYQELLQNILLSFNGVDKVYLEDISYFKAENNYVELYLVGKEEPLWIYEKIKDVEEKTKNLSICRVHKSYMVNFMDVLIVQNNKIIMKNKVEIPISRGKKKEIEEEFFKYKMKQMRNRLQ